MSSVAPASGCPPRRRRTKTAARPREHAAVLPHDQSDDPHARGVGGVEHRRDQIFHERELVHDARGLQRVCHRDPRGEISRRTRGWDVSDRLSGAHVDAALDAPSADAHGNV